MMVQDDVAEVNKTLTPLLSVVRQYLEELLYNSSTLTDASTRPMFNNDNELLVVPDNLKGDASDTSVLAMGKYIFSEAFFFNL